MKRIEPENEAARIVSPNKSSWKVFKAFSSELPYITGRRKYFKYRDLGLKEASAGDMRGNLIITIAGMTQGTGWHYHLCEFQWVYYLKGTASLEFEDGTVAYCEAGDSLFIPGGVKHNELTISEDNEALEISLPGEIGTVPCDRPAGLPLKLEAVGAVGNCS